MKKYFLLTLATGLLAALTACNFHIAHFSSNSANSWSSADLAASTNITQTAAIPAGLKILHVSNRLGAVHVTGTDSGATAWTWKLAVRARTEEAAQRIAAATTCQARLDGDQLNLVVSLPETTEPHSFQSDLEITVPKSVTVAAENHFGPMEIASLSGDVGATNQNGRLQITDIIGAVRAQTSFDSLTASNTGPATLRDQNGRLRALAIGGRLEAATSFDSLLAQDIRGPAILVDQNGRIEATSIHGTLDAQTSFDSLIARDIGGAAQLRDQNGRIEATSIDGSLHAKTSFDSLLARDINGPVNLLDQNGSIKIAQIKGDADIETSFDTLSVEGVQGNATLRNRNGRVVASGVTGTVQADTSFAALDVTGDGAKFICHNQNGSIHLRATSPAVTEVEARTSFDSLEVHLPAALKPAIQAHTSFAEVKSDFPFANSLAANTVNGETTARVTLENQNGHIGIVRD